MQYFLYTETRWALGRWKFMVMERGSFQTVATAMAFHAFTLAFVRFGCTRKKNLQKSETRIFTQIRRSLFAVHSIRFFFLLWMGIYFTWIRALIDTYGKGFWDGTNTSRGWRLNVIDATMNDFCLPLAFGLFTLENRLHQTMTCSWKNLLKLFWNPFMHGNILRIKNMRALWFGFISWLKFTNKSN